MVASSAVPRREMDRDYWDGMATGYEKEILSVLHHDERGLIRKHIRRIASPRATVADIGCGIGHFLPLLSESFGSVYANDISTQLLERARKVNGHRQNIVFLAGDAVAVLPGIPLVDCILSVNALIVSSLGLRAKMFRAMAQRLKPGGHLVLVVPSLESMLLVDVRFLEWKLKRGMKPSRALGEVYPRRGLVDNNLRRGIIDIDGVATKHYLQEELLAVLKSHKLDLIETARIEYGWDSEFERPPLWMQAPYPWDWLVVARRRK